MYWASLVSQMVKSLPTGDLSSIPWLGRSPGEGNGNPLHYSCLENPMDRGARWFIVHGVARVRHNWTTKPPQCIYVHPNLPFYPSRQSPGNHVCLLHLWLQKTYFRYAVASGVQQLMFSHLFTESSDVSDCMQGVSGEPCTLKQRCESFWVLCYRLSSNGSRQTNTTWCVLEAVF